MSDYDFQDIETRWQKTWAETGAFEVTEDPKRPKFYCLEMLPYPSGDIHVGHVRNYCITDVISRCKTMRGFNVMHPIGWDALGLPAENAAIKRGIHPEKWTRAEHRGHEAAAPAARLQLSLEPRDRDLRRRVLPLEPVVLPAHARAGHRLPRQGARQLVPVVPHRARQRAGRGRHLLALQEPGRAARHGAVVPPDHRLPGPAPRRHGRSSRPGRSACSSSRRTGSASPTAPRSTSRSRAASRSASSRPASTRSAARPSWSSPPSTRWSTASSRGRRTRPARKEQIARLRAQDRRARLEGRVEKEGVFTGRYATNPFTDEKIPVWVGQLRADGLRHGRHHVRPRPRPARLRVRPQVRPRGARRHPARGRAPRRRHDAGRVRRRRTRRQQRALRRPDGRRGHPEDGRVGAGRRASARPRSRTASRTGSSAASATGARRSRSSTARRTACSRCPTTSCRSSSRPTRRSPARAATRSRRCRRS